MLRKHRCSRKESLPHEVVELILERLPVKSLLRFRAVSKEWRSTIQSRYFQERQLVHRQQSGDPDVLMVSIIPFDVAGPDLYIEPLRTLVLGASESVKIPSPWDNTNYLVSISTCDGLVCVYHARKSGFVFNPTTRWHRALPLCELQKHMIDLGKSSYKLGQTFFNLGFGKDKFKGTYKPVCLYNSQEIGRENATTCEVFDFCTDSWRYVTPASPYRIIGAPEPVCVDGSVHWVTECKETKVLSFDLQTESFQVISKAPFADALRDEIVLCNLDNRLCISAMKWPNQVIWSFHSSSKTWDKMYSIDLDLTSRCYDIPTLCTPPLVCALLPLALLDGQKKKKKLLFHDRVLSRNLMIHDPETKSYDAAFSAEAIGSPVCYFQSLFSI